MHLSIVIVNYNVKLFLEQCLLSVRSAIVGLECEVIVVDNQSTDDSKSYLEPKFPDVNFIWNKHNVGFSTANNQAISIAKGKYILLLNPDTLVGENLFYRVIQFMEEHPNAGGVGVTMIDRTGAFLPESKRSLPTPWNSFTKMFGLASLFPKSPLFGKYRLLYLDKNKIHRVEVLSGAFMMLRAEALAKSGLLDETFFMYGEDIDLSYRIIIAGYDNYYLPETIIHYKGESTQKGSLKYIRSFYGAMLIFYRKHYPRHSFYFSFLVQCAIGAHLSYSYFKNSLKHSIIRKSNSVDLLMPKSGESYESLIKRVELGE
ncbi:MAG: glycosyltransferase family 2 protein [Bacteroidales bacterium]